VRILNSFDLFPRSKKEKAAGRDQHKQALMAKKTQKLMKKKAAIRANI